MERVEGARTPYEVYCFRCRVTFPLETRRCLYCGGTLYGAGDRAAAARPVASVAQLPIPAREDEEDGPISAVRRYGGLAIWAIVALGAVISNLCSRGPG
ncbi:MAG TPA: hypothetical protein VKH41_00490 [Myxococcota bacterium]|nr:hypothetical protein [Myxococcota bacterium]